MKKSLEAQLEYLYHLERFETIKPGLLTMERLLSALGNPHQQFPSVHIAGTNGKSSTALLIAACLTTAGYKTALYTSPHLITFNERVRLNNQNIDDETLASLIPEVRQAAKDARLSPTFFEFTTALAFLYFARQQAEIAIIEVGMGGDLDATNVITPLISVITNIGTDHTAWLGRTKSERARHKAGIIKPGIPVITGEKDPDIIKIFTDFANRNKASLQQTPKTIHLTSRTSHLTGQSFTVHFKKNRSSDPPPLGGGVRGGDNVSDSKSTMEHNQSDLNRIFHISLLGHHQLENTATALRVLNQLKYQGFPVPLPLIKKTLAETKHPGRLDIISTEPFILLDGAHNPEGIIALKKFLTETELPPPDTLLLGLKKDKDPQQVIEHIAPMFRNIIVTEASYQPMPARDLAILIQKHLPATKIQTIPNLKEALSTAEKNQHPKTMQLITGSLYLIGDTLKILK